MNQPTHILLIEDDPAVARSLRDGLERDGYAVTWKASGTEGVSHARDRNPQLIILDVRLPDGSGFDFCRQMRQLGLRQPILMLTVRHDEMDKVLGLEMGPTITSPNPTACASCSLASGPCCAALTASCQPPTLTNSTPATWSSIAAGGRYGGATNSST